MELNIIKQPVTVNEVLFEQSAEQPVDTDFTLPDYCPDIVRILKCRVIPRLMSKNITGDSMSIDGSVCATLIYADEDNKICSYEHEIQFEKNMNVGDVGDNCYLSVKLNNDYMNCRAITPRKVDIHGVVNMKIKVCGNKSTEIITDVDCPGMQLKRGNCPATNPLGFAEKTVVLEEELELSKGSGTVRSVLRSDCRAIVEECKIVNGKAVVRGDVVINALYCTEEGTTELYGNRIPYNQIIDINVEGVDCKSEAKVNIMSSVLKPRTNISGESKSFAFECKLCILVNASCENDIPVIYDAFNTARDSELVTAAVDFKKLDTSINERYICKKNLEFSEGTFGTVVDMWCENKIGQVKVDKNSLNVGGTVLICLLACDKEGVPQYYERSVDFEYTNALECEAENLSADVDICTVSSAYTILAEDKLEARIELSISAGIYSSNRINVITGVELKETKSSKRKSPLIIYYAEAGEDLWDISKKYNSCCEEIRSLNKLESDMLNDKSTLLIP